MSMRKIAQALDILCDALVEAEGKIEGELWSDEDYDTIQLIIRDLLLE